MTLENTDSNSQEVITTPEITDSEQTQVSEENVNKEETSLEQNEEVKAEETTEAKEEEVVETDLTEINEPEKATEVLKDKGFDYSKLQDEYNQTGAISEETRAKLAEGGISGELIDNFIEGRKAVVEKELDEMSTVVGGREQMQTIIDWAGKNLTPAEAESINAIRDKNVIKIILKDLKSRMEEAEGIVPEYVKGGGNHVSESLYESMAQMEEAIRDPRYHKDEAYRNKVKKIIDASVGAGTLTF